MNRPFFSHRRVFPKLLALAGATLAGTPSVHAQTEPFVWRYSSPEAQGVDSTQLARLLAQVQRDGVGMHSFVLVRHGRVVAEAYFYPYAAGSRHAMYSVSKSFTSSLIGIAIGQGLIRDVDERVADIFSGVTDHPLAERMGRMTLRHLLTMASGHADDTTSRITATANWERAFMELNVEEEPGTRFVYNSGGSYMLAAAVQRRVGMTTAEFARRNLFEPLGITEYSWDTSPTGIVCGGWGLSLRPLDMARFGQMYLQRGRWEGRQVVPEAWVDAATRKRMENGTAGFWGSGYGYQFWMNDFGGYRADGAFGQFIFVLPEHDLVAVFTNNLTDTALPGRLLRQYLLPNLSDTALAANPRGEALLARAAEVLGAAPTAVVAPAFLQLPESRAATAGETVTFTVAGSGSPTCQWYRDEREIPGATDPTLRIANVSPADRGSYHAVLRNRAGATASFPVTLAVIAPPAILAPPASLTVGEGGQAVFSVRAAGEDLRFEWRHNGAAVPGASGDTLRLASVGPEAAGEYTVVVSNPRGSMLSPPARLTVRAADGTARLVNLSVRARAGSADRTLIIGLVVTGGDAGSGLPVLLRAVGPSLAPLGVADVLADPAAVLFRLGNPIATNADWRTGLAGLAGTMARVGAFTIPAGSADAAIETVLAPRPYTMHVISSLPDRAGVALAECYDASGSGATDGPQLANVSARADAGTGDSTLAVGFVITGSGTRRVLIRGVGPTLTTQGVNGVLADPELRLFSRQTEIAANDNWGGGEETRSAFAQAGAFALPADSADAALVVSLPAGVYSAQVTGHDNGTGVALVEVYALP